MFDRLTMPPKFGGVDALLRIVGRNEAPGVAAGAGVGHLVEQLEDGAPVHIAREIGHVGRHERHRLS